ncbi:MgtC/SapB family protein [Halobacillus yeomjeoni]|uniref:MgtC/SapB family protein n=1 Tax=Halobacillus yeomjeoni TaxID=311194 RepID=UPI001CD4D520|nr:MgtC/SapB family protein [Halobacillus yeomjeoni]MCA0985535.1 MgtC/SapB family protein [Halobacillus yeomjeoni]
MEWSGFYNDNTMLFIFRLLMALLLAGLIGFERELKNHSAGFRTHILVGIGACLMMLLSLYGFEVYMGGHENIRFDPARIPSYVISGIGFLGAGTIIVNGMTIRGLTTAASIWTVAGIGLVVGAGMYDIAIISTSLVLLSLIFLNKIEKRKFKENGKNLYYIKVEPDIQLQNVFSVFDEMELKVKRVEIKNQENEYQKLVIGIENNKKEEPTQIIEQLSRLESVIRVSHRT